MTQKHGRRYEHELVNGLHEITPPEAWVTTCGYSGNDATTGCDLVVTKDPQLITRVESSQVNIEAKKRRGEGGERVTVFSGSAGEENGVEEVERLMETTPSWGDAVVAIKFDRRKLVVLKAKWILSYLGEIDFHIPPTVEETFKVLKPRTTPSGNISMVKPSLDDWESSTAAKADEVVLAEKMGLPYDVNDD